MLVLLILINFDQIKPKTNTRNQNYICTVKLCLIQLDRAAANMSLMSEHAEGIDTPVTLFKIQIECRKIILIMYAVAQQEGDDDQMTAITEESPLSRMKIQGMKLEYIQPV